MLKFENAPVSQPTQVRVILESDEIATREADAVDTNEAQDNCCYEDCYGGPAGVLVEFSDGQVRWVCQEELMFDLVQIMDYLNGISDKYPDKVRANSER